MRRRRRSHSGPQWPAGGEPGAVLNARARWWNRDSIPGPVLAPPIAAIEADLCIGCGQCVSACPAGAICVGPEGKAAVNELLCRGCAACVEVCPAGAVRMSQPVGSGRRGEMTDEQGSMRTKHQ